MNPSKLLLAMNAASLTAATSRSIVDGKEHMIVPVIAIREGVLNGVFYSSDELKVFANAWNGVPVPVTHPKDSNDNFITANSPSVEQTHNIGRFYNVEFDSNISALKGELWINIEKANLLGHQDLLARLDAGENINISTGLWTDAIDSRGNYNGKTYDYVATSIRPDHLAILPNELGACSVKDGCGTFIHNCSGSKSCPCKDKPKEKLPNAFSVAFNTVKKVLGFEVNEISHSDLRERLRSAITTNLNDTDRWSYIVDVYDKFFVYEQNDMLLKQGYAVDAADQVSLIGDPFQVFIEKTYKATSPSPTNNTDNKKNMKCATNLMVLSSLLAANTITSAQKANLEELPDDVFESFIANKNAIVSPAPATTPVALSNDDRQLLDSLKAERDSRVGKLRAHVKENYKAVDASVIDSMDVVQLEALAKAAPVTNGQSVDFTLFGGAPTPVVNAEKAEYNHPSILTAPVQ